MKTIKRVVGKLLLCGLCLAVSQAWAQTVPPASSAASGGQTPPEPTAWQITKRAANQRVWERIVYAGSPSGKIIAQKHSYTELAAGMCHQNASGQWVDSREQIDAYPQGAIASQGQYQTIFASDLNSAGAIDQQTPDGKRLRSNILGLAYYDHASGQSVMIAEVRDSPGELIATNQVLYPNAFTGIKADVRYTYKQGGFEQDVILREQPPTPESLGLDSQNTEIEVLTEFIGPPTATIKPHRLKNSSLTDEDISWGAMHLGHGKAFDLGEPPGTPSKVTTRRQYETVNGRTILIEAVPMPKIQVSLSSLPLQASLRTKPPVYASRTPALPKILRARTSPRPMKLAETAPASKGYVLDYIEMNVDTNDFTFQGDTSYLISADVNLGGITTFEGGTVIKYANGASLYGSFNTARLRTSPYRPVVLTSLDDNSAGEIISGSTGSPATLGSGIYLNDYYGDLPIVENFGQLRFSYAAIAYMNVGNDYFFEFNDCQFIQCGTAISLSDASTLALNNDLFAQCGLVVDAGLTLNACNVTVDQCVSFDDSLDGDNYGGITNSIFTGSGIVSPYYTYDDTVTLSTSAGVFQTSGGGHYYLPAGSPYHNAGTANIDPALLADLATKTTYPPIVYTSPAGFYSNSLDLFPQATRDTNASPDLGYHYAPLDYICGGMCVTNATITLEAGTALGIFGTNNSSSHEYGLAINADAHFISVGLPTSLNHVAFYNTVQEQNAPGWVKPYAGMIISWAGTSAHYQCQFTDWSVMAEDTWHVWLWYTGTLPAECFSDCQFHGGQLETDYPTLCLTNCLLERVYAGLYPQDANTSVVRNNLFYGGTFDFAPSELNSIIADNAFDRAAIPDEMAGMGTWYFGGHNAYVTNCNTLDFTWPGDQILSNSPAYETGPLGDYYQPTNSPLINAGSTNANLVGLYHFTVTTNEVIDGFNTVSIGYHHVATDADGNPLDTNGDGIPDYLEDANGDGIFDAGDVADWQAPVYGTGRMTFPGGAAIYIFEPKPAAIIP